jgi:hypothetical protein
MFNFGLLYLHRDDGPSMADLIHPFIGAEHAQPLRYRLIERVGANFDGMLHAMQIATRDLAGSKRHERSVAYSLFIRHPTDCLILADCGGT